MAKHKIRVIGPFEVGGTKPGRTVVLDDDEVNIDALLSARHIEIVPEPKPKKKEDD